MTNALQLTKPAKTSTSQTEKTFNKLRKEIEALEDELKLVIEELDKSLVLYNEQCFPKKIALANVLTEFVRATYSHYTSYPRLSKKNKTNVKETIIEKIDFIFEVILSSQVHSEIHTIYKELEGVSYAEHVAEDLTGLKEELEEDFKDQGIDIDLSSINFTDDEEEIERKMYESIQAAKEKYGEKPEKPKNKKQIQKDEKAKQLQTLKEKGLSTVYKNLAKVLHPDLEQSPALKIEKERLMKKLTHAYDNDDLYTILQIEMEWSKKENGHTAFNPSQLNVYNSILKDQILALKECIRLTFAHPKYYPLEPYFQNIMFDVSIDQSLDSHCHQLQSKIAFFKKVTRDLLGAKAEKAFKVLLEMLDE